MDRKVSNLLAALETAIYTLEKCHEPRCEDPLCEVCNALRICIEALDEAEAALKISAACQAGGTKTCKFCGLPIAPKPYYKASNDPGFCSYECKYVYKYVYWIDQR